MENKYTCKLAGMKDAPIYSLSHSELVSMSLSYPMFILHNGNWKGILHTGSSIIF